VSRTRAPDISARLEALIEDVHDAALDPGLWPQVAGRVAAAFRANSAALHLRDNRLGAVQPLSFTDNYADADVSAYGNHYAKEDLWAGRAAAVAPGKVMVSDELASLREMERTAWYTDWCVPFDVRHLVGSVVPVGGDSIAVIGVHRSTRLGSFNQTEQRLMRAFLPHLRRALQVYQRLAEVNLELQAANELATRHGTGTLIAAADGRLLWADAQAEQILLTDRGLRISGGRICTALPSETERLRQMLRSAAEAAAGRFSPPGGAMMIERGEGRLPLSILAAPFRPKRDGHGGHAPAAIVFLRCPERSEAAGGTENLRQIFGLTSAEAAIAAALASGHSVETIASRNAVSLNTVRVHLKAVMAKTGTHRQAELVSLIFRSAAVLGR
jgi:DNA-binding CsgD family transcriptional regulator